MEKREGKRITQTFLIRNYELRLTTYDSRDARCEIRDTQNRQRADGFTLIEIAVIVVILSSLLLISFPKFQNIFPQTHLLSSARRIAGEVRRLYHEAVFTGRRSCLSLALEKGEYLALREVPGAEMEKLDGGLGRLLPGVRFQDVVVAGKKINEGTAHIDFSPYGLIEHSIIHLVNSDGDELSIIINRFTGKVELSPGYKELREL